jgi:hypothetical protein
MFGKQRHFRGAYSLHLRAVTLLCARTEYLKMEQTIPSKTSVHYLPFNTASYLTNLESPTIPL